MKKLLIVPIIVLFFIGWVYFPTNTAKTQSPSQDKSDSLKVQAKDIYKYNCSMCHGPSGQGNGPTAHALTVKPPDWTNSYWQSAMTDVGIKNAIVGGGKFIGRSDFMPAHPQYKNDPILDELVKIVRQYGR